MTREASIVRAIRAYLDPLRGPVYYEKRWGGPYSTVGAPDLSLCVGHGEFALLADLPELGADERGVRECQLCPPWVECAHFGDQAIHLYSGSKYADLPCTDAHYGHGLWKVVGPGVLQTAPAMAVCSHWRGRYCINENGPEFTTEAEARAEFERRCALMLGREVE